MQSGKVYRIIAKGENKTWCVNACRSVYTCMHTHTRTLKHLPRGCKDLGILRTLRLSGAVVGREESCVERGEPLGSKQPS